MINAEHLKVIAARVAVAANEEFNSFLGTLGLSPSDFKKPRKTPKGITTEVYVEGNSLTGAYMVKFSEVVQKSRKSITRVLGKPEVIRGDTGDWICTWTVPTKGKVCLDSEGILKLLK